MPSTYKYVNKKGEIDPCEHCRRLLKYETSSLTTCANTDKILNYKQTID